MPRFKLTNETQVLRVPDPRNGQLWTFLRGNAVVEVPRPLPQYVRDFLAQNLIEETDEPERQNDVPLFAPNIMPPIVPFWELTEQNAHINTDAAGVPFSTPPEVATSPEIVARSEVAENQAKARPSRHK